jgi:hypothetical protein
MASASDVTQHSKWKSTDITDECTVPSSVKKKETKQETSNKHSLCLLLASLDYSSTLKMEALCSSETSAHFHRTTWRHIPQDSHRCKNMKSKAND